MHREPDLGTDEVDGDWVEGEYSFGALKIEAMPQLALCNSRSLKQAPARKKWNSSLPWTGFWKDITSIYCSNLRYFTTSGKMDAKGTNAW